MLTLPSSTQPHWKAWYQSIIFFPRMPGSWPLQWCHPGSGWLQAQRVRSVPYWITLSSKSKGRPSPNAWTPTSAPGLLFLPRVHWTIDISACPSLVLFSFYSAFAFKTVWAMLAFSASTHHGHVDKSFEQNPLFWNELPSQLPHHRTPLVDFSSLALVVGSWRSMAITAKKNYKFQTTGT